MKLKTVNFVLRLYVAFCVVEIILDFWLKEILSDETIPENYLIFFFVSMLKINFMYKFS